MTNADLIAKLRSNADAHHEPDSTERRRAANALEQAGKELAEANQTLIELKPDPVLVEGSWFPVNDLPKILGNYIRASDEQGRELKARHLKLSEQAATIEAALESLRAGEYLFRTIKILSRSTPTTDAFGSIATVAAPPKESQTEAVKLDPDQHVVRQGPPWPAYPDADYMLTQWKCSCGWFSPQVKDVRGDAGLAIVRLQTERHAAAKLPEKGEN